MVLGRGESSISLTRGVYALFKIKIKSQINVGDLKTANTLFFGIVFGIGMKTDLFQSCSHC